MTEHFDVIVVGAGISGIGAAWHLQTHAPDRSYLILEGRDRMGGTWDLFRYPGIRSDSDMYTLGFAFKPWTKAKAIADGATILDYVEETARENHIDRHIRYCHRLTRADWSSAEARWTVRVDRGGEHVEFTCSFLFMCTGYYNYARGFTPEFAGVADFEGRIVHPQFWTPDVDYAGKRVVVIGSGATAVTLVPELAKQAAKVTMLQRSPTYIVSQPSHDGIADWLLEPQDHCLFGLRYDRQGARQQDHGEQGQDADRDRVAEKGGVHRGAAPFTVTSASGSFLAPCDSGRYGITPGASTIVLSVLARTSSIVS